MVQNQSAIEFNKLPLSVKDWVSSLRATYLIMEINKKLGLINGEREIIIPSLIFKLITKSIDPSDFINELSHELNISFENAKTVTEDIEKNVLHPVELDLRGDLDIDIKLFYLGKPKPRSEEGLPQTARAAEAAIKSVSNEKTGPIVDLQSFKIKSDRPLSPMTFAPAMKEEKSAASQATNPSTGSGQEKEREIPATPFILHQETPTSAPSISPNGSAGSPQRPQEAPSIKSSLTMKVQNFYQSSSAPERPASKPVSIKVETSSSSFNAQKTQQPVQINKQDAPPAPKPESLPMPVNASQESRVVHYSNLRTPLNTIGLPKNEIGKDNVLDLRKIVK